MATRTKQAPARRRTTPRPTDLERRAQSEWGEELERLATGRDKAITIRQELLTQLDARFEHARRESGDLDPEEATRVLGLARAAAKWATDLDGLWDQRIPADRLESDGHLATLIRESVDGIVRRLVSLDYWTCAAWQAICESEQLTRDALATASDPVPNVAGLSGHAHQAAIDYAKDCRRRWVRLAIRLGSTRTPEELALIREVGEEPKHLTRSALVSGYGSIFLSMCEAPENVERPGWKLLDAYLNTQEAGLRRQKAAGAQSDDETATPAPSGLDAGRAEGSGRVNQPRHPKTLPAGLPNDWMSVKETIAQCVQARDEGFKNHKDPKRRAAISRRLHNLIKSETVPIYEAGYPEYTRIERPSRIPKTALIPESKISHLIKLLNQKDGSQHDRSPKDKGLQGATTKHGVAALTV